jgi:hypothetical protein
MRTREIYSNFLMLATTQRYYRALIPEFMAWHSASLLSLSFSVGYPGRALLSRDHA